MVWCGRIARLSLRVGWVYSAKTLSAKRMTYSLPSLVAQHYNTLNFNAYVYTDNSLRLIITSSASSAERRKGSSLRHVWFRTSAVAAIA